MNYKDARAAWTPSTPLTLVHNADVETADLDATAARLAAELRSLGSLIRATRQDLEAMENVRMRKADALEATMRSLAARVKA